MPLSLAWLMEAWCTFHWLAQHLAYEMFGAGMPALLVQFAVRVLMRDSCVALEVQVVGSRNLNVSAGGPV